MKDQSEPGDRPSTTPSRPDTHGDMVEDLKLLELGLDTLQDCVEDLTQLERSTSSASRSAALSLRMKVYRTHLLIVSYLRSQQYSSIAMERNFCPFDLPPLNVGRSLNIDSLGIPRAT